MLDNQVLGMTPGQALLDVPVADLIQKMGVAIAEAQLRLDQMAVRVASLLGDTKVSFRDAAGNATEKSLLELGFTPTFYHFTEAEIEVKLTLAMKVEEALTVGLGASVGSGAGAAAPAGEGEDEGEGEDDADDLAEVDEDAGEDADDDADEEEEEEDGAARPAADRRPVVFGAAINAEYHRKYEFDMSGSSTIRTKMVSVPPPSAFLEAIKTHARTGGTIA